MIPSNLETLSEIEIASLLKPLNPQERRIIKLRFGLGGGGVATLTGVSDAVGIPRERVRKIELQAMEKLGWVTFVK